ncbi:hypothetical protein AYO40_00995 [Planctomycetaceae bacterium SCGC AG-212-D15]|nr:hypothetical protein AYO40_00995 [Planctomycetaceae bacterium SCGC AG-212-D15]
MSLPSISHVARQVWASVENPASYNSDDLVEATRQEYAAMGGDPAKVTSMNVKECFKRTRRKLHGNVTRKALLEINGETAGRPVRFKEVSRPDSLPVIDPMIDEIVTINHLTKTAAFIREIGSILQARALLDVVESVRS